MHVLCLVTLILNVLTCSGQTFVVHVVELPNNLGVTLICNTPSSTTLTRWTYLAGSTGTSFMSYQNGTCTVSPSDSFLSGSRYSYRCSNTMYQLIMHSFTGSWNNHILACNEAVKPDRTVHAWMIKEYQDGERCNCYPYRTFSIREITEGDNVTFICRVSSDVPYVNWDRNTGSNTAAMGVGQNGQCATQGTTFLGDTSAYIYTCNSTVYQVTRLNVQRSEHNDMYMCTSSTQQEGTGSNWIIKINAPLTFVAMKPADYLINVKESTTVVFTCTTSTARPAASVYWYRHPNGNWQNETQITVNITTVTDYNDLSITTSILRLVPTRQDNGTKIYCRANNSINAGLVQTSMKKLLNVLYKADDPYIPQGREYRVIENTPVTLSCSVNGGNPKQTLSWSCYNFSPTNQSTIDSDGNVTATLTWTPFRTYEGSCTCTSEQKGFPNTTAEVSLIVLYPPSKPVFTVNGNSVNGDVHYIEGNIGSIKCTADSKPSPDKYTWTGSRLTDSVNIQALTFTTLKKEDAGKYTCSVYNIMNPSNGSLLGGINSSAVNVIVLYPPSALYFVYDNQSGQNISNKVIDVIEGDTFNIVCKSIDGVPSPAISWNGQNNNMSVLIVENIQESRTNATCTATNSMQETNRPVVHGLLSDTIRFNIIVRLAIRSCDFHNKNLPNKGFILSQDNPLTLMINENESFTIKCFIEGRPFYAWWQTPQRSKVLSESVTVNNLTRDMKGDYVFTLNNLIEPSFKDKQNVTVNKTVSVQVLYPPAVQPINDISKLNGTRLNLVCNFTAGMPETTMIKWTRDIDNKEWNTVTLNIGSLEKSDTGKYMCTASNTMKQSGDSISYIGQHNQSFHLDVQYAASITSFTVGDFTNQTVTFNESDPIRLICIADSNPTAVMTLSREREKLITVTSNIVEYNIAEASCSDAATYYCSATNEYNDYNGVYHTVQLFVNCLPRVVEEIIDVNITSEKNKTATIVFNVIAYPPPTFTWYQLVDGNWILLDDGDKYFIESTTLQCNLTIHGVGINDFTRYKVAVENDFGQMEQIYTLSPYDKPDSPSSLRYYEDRTTTSSILIEWEPGFDNGPSQTFFIKYKKTSDTVWNYRTVIDNGEPTMNLTLTGLMENTQYEVIMFASNVKGNSTETNVLLVKTKAIQFPPSIPGALIGGITGAVTGCIIIVAVIIIIIRKYPLFEVCSENVARGKSDRTSQPAEGNDYYNVGSDTNGNDNSARDSAYENVTSDTEYETFNQNKVESTPYSTLDETELCSTLDDTSDENVAVYENLKLQVF